MIKAVIFDMDGLLIDSEPLWREACIKVFTKLNVPLTIKRAQETMGLRVDEVVEHWYALYPWGNLEKEKVVAEIVDAVINLIKSKGEMMEGVHEIIDLFESQHMPMAIASSSSVAIINTVLDKINVREKMKVIHSAEHEPYGKPHPGVYITTAEKLGFLPTECLAFEDSPNGVLSAKSAKMKCVAVPELSSKNDKRILIADLVLNSLLDFKLETIEKL